jgi:uncharacterized protein (TIGR02466 family)|tara:strand:+ start:724 stop:1338 length:615 start_codon:yes stop_codon:yes gene_type:complete
MEKEGILGFPLYRFYYPKDKIQELEELKSNILMLNWRKNPKNWIWADSDNGKNLHDLPQFAELFSWINGCLEEVKKDLKLSCESLSIVSSWANVNLRGEGFHDHIHPNAFASSNFYVSGPEDSFTVWHKENPFFDNNIFPGDEDTHIYHYERTEPGKYVVFPPHFYHYSTPNSEIEERVTVAANVFPEGLISANGVSRMRISVH